MARVKATEIPQSMRDIDAYQGDLVTRFALRLMAQTFVRTTDHPNGGDQIGPCRHAYESASDQVRDRLAVTSSRAVINPTQTAAAF